MASPSCRARRLDLNAASDPQFPLTLLRYVIRTGAEVIEDSITGVSRFAADPYVQLQRPRAVMCLPIRHGGQIDGILYFENRLAEASFTQERVAFLRMLGVQAMISISSARLHDSLERRVAERTEQLEDANRKLATLSITDGLTGLSNRAFMEAELERAILEARIGNGKVAVLFLDSDRFKYINDTFGHASGDRVLVTIAARIKQQLREGDLVARLGGDEFAILLKPLRNSSDAMHIADNIITAMAQAIELPTGNSIVTSLTIGVAVFPDHAIDAVSLVGAADEAMYRAKQAQRGTRQVARLPQPHTHP